MKDTCTYSNSKDFRARYAGTIGAYTKPDGSVMPVWIEGVNEERVVFKDAEGRSYTANNNKEVSFEFTQVPRGWYNTPSGPVLFFRTGQRQWQRGISSNNTAVRDIDGNRGNISLSIVKDALFSPSPVRKTGAPWALSKFFAVSSTVVWFLDKIIGRVEGNTLIIDSPCMVLEELRDTIRRNNLEYVLA